MDNCNNSDITYTSVVVKGHDRPWKWSTEVEIAPGGRTADAFLPFQLFIAVLLWQATMMIYVENVLRIGSNVYHCALVYTQTE